MDMKKLGVGTAASLACLLAVSVWGCRAASSQPLIRYMEKLRYGMSLSEVDNLIPEKYFVEREEVRFPEISLDVSFNTNSYPTTELIYDQSFPFGGGGYGAIVYFDATGEIVGFSYTGSSVPADPRNYTPQIVCG